MGAHRWWSWDPVPWTWSWGLSRNRQWWNRVQWKCWVWPQLCELWNPSTLQPVLRTSSICLWSLPSSSPVKTPAGGEEPSAKRGKVTSEWDEAHDAEEAAARAGGAPRRRNRWDETPVGPGAPGAAGPSSRWDQTPVAAGPQKAAGGAASARPRSRWDETPVAAGPGGALAPGAATPAGLGAGGMATPLIAGGGGASLAEMTPEQFHVAK